MKTTSNKGFSLHEMLVVVAVIAVVIVILITTGNRLREQANIKAAENTLLVLSTALERYYSKYGQYPFEAAPYLPDAEPEDEGFTENDLHILIGGGWQNRENDTEKANYMASIAGLYRKLNSDNEIAEILGAVPDKFLTARNSENAVIMLGGEPLIRIIDPWGNPYRYIYIDGQGTAVIESAGPSGKFGRTPAGEDAEEDKKNNDNISF